MIGDTEYGRLRQRAKSPSAMTAENPVLASGELAATINGTEFVVKMGNGTTAWNDLPALNVGGGGGGPVPYPRQVRKTVFETFDVPRDPATGEFDVDAIVWDAPRYEFTNDLGAYETTIDKPDWGGYAPDSGSTYLFLTDPDEGRGWYEFQVYYSFGLPEADAFEGAAGKIQWDVIDPVWHVAPLTAKTGGLRGVSGSWRTGPVPLGNDDGSRLLFKVYGDPATGAGTGYAPSGEGIAMLRVEMIHLTNFGWRNYTLEG